MKMDQVTQKFHPTIFSEVSSIYQLTTVIPILLVVIVISNIQITILTLQIQIPLILENRNDLGNTQQQHRRKQKYLEEEVDQMYGSFFYNLDLTFFTLLILLIHPKFPVFDSFYHLQPTNQSTPRKTTHP